MDTSLNLLTKEEKRKQFQVKAVKLSTVFTILLLILSGAAAGYFYMTSRNIKSDVEEAETRISSARAEINSLPEVEIAARNLYQKYSVVEDIFSNRPHYSYLLDHFDSKIPSGVSVSSFSFRGGDEINISGDADNYVLVAEFLEALNEEESEGDQVFMSASLSSASLTSSDRTVSYTITLTYDAGALKERD